MQKHILIMMLLLLPAVAAIGIGPATQDIEYAPDSTKTIDLRIYNTDAEDMTIPLEIEGTLAPYINAPKEVVLVSTKPVETISVDVEFSQDMVEGTHEGIFKLEDKGIYVTSKVTTNVPERPKLSVDVKLDSKELVIVVDNPSEKPISAILDSTLSEDIEFLHKVKLEPGESKEIIENVDLKDGTYDVVISVTVEGSEFIIEKSFDIGEQKTKITGFSAKNVDDTLRFDVTVMNGWSGTIEDSYLKVELIDKDGNPIIETVSNSYVLEPKSEQDIKTDFDGIIPTGNYVLRLTSYNGDNQISKDYDVMYDGTELRKTGGFPFWTIGVIVLIAGLVIGLFIIKKNNIEIYFS